MNDITRLKAGSRALINVPFSEACMHMRLAGTNMIAEIMPGSQGRFGPYVRLEKPDNPHWYTTVGLGEGGFTQDGDCDFDEVVPLYGTLVSEHGPDFYQRAEVEAAIYETRCAMTGVPA